MKKFVSLYYLALFVFSLYHAAATIFSTGELLLARSRLAELKNKSKTLEEKQLSERATQFSQLSLIDLQESEYTKGFLKISRPVALTQSDNLAYDAN